MSRKELIARLPWRGAGVYQKVFRHEAGENRPEGGYGVYAEALGVDVSYFYGDKPTLEPMSGLASRLERVEIQLSQLTAVVELLLRRAAT